MTEPASTKTATSALASEIATRRTFAIISHPDAGKTTLTEKLLLYGGAVQQAGAVKARRASRHATSDWMEVEKQRGISVSSAVMRFDYGGKTINLLDTPGHEDFSEDTYRVLTAVDAAVMVIDAAKGVEAQTIKLLDVCRLRNTPIITFINKFDREVRGPLELLEDVEATLKIDCAPVTWPLGMGKTFRGVFHLYEKRLRRFRAGEARLNRGDEELIEGYDNARLDELFPGEVGMFRDEVELLREASAPVDRELFLAGMQTPVFFGSALNNFGVEDVLEALTAWAPPPQSREAVERVVQPDEEKLTGFVFKIQANMDPKHRDRLAFFRLCSGRYTPGKRLRHLRLDREMRINNALVFMANARVRSEDAVAGDIIGIHNHGQLQIGDTLTEGELLNYKGIPYFAPELFLAVRPKDPFRTKQLAKGLKELGEEGAIQVLTTQAGRLLLGAVGQLQFEIVGHRLREEYNADPVYEPVDIYTARWLSFPDAETQKKFELRESARMGTDVDGNPVYLATNLYNLRIAEERWSDVTFRTTREHGEIVN